MEADTTPERPCGKTTILIISQRVAPSASEASSCRRGVWRNTSRDREVMIGKIMIARMMPPMRMLRPGGTKVVASPAGHQEYFWAS